MTDKSGQKYLTLQFRVHDSQSAAHGVADRRHRMCYEMQHVERCKLSERALLKPVMRTGVYPLASRGIDLAAISRDFT